MAIHDAYARRTPYELFLPDEDFAEEHFTAVEAEAEERDVADLSDPDRFVMLMAAGEALRELRGPHEDPERIRQHGLLLFHAYHFRAAGKLLWLLPMPAARYLVEASAPPEAKPRPPSSAGYLQLPQHLFWSRPEGDGGGVAAEARAGGDGGGERKGPGPAGEPAAASPESVDGIFWVAGAGRLSVLSVLGVRPDRPGFSVAPLPPVSLADAPTWASAAMRAGGEEDFRSDMPGAELESLYEVRTAGEILKLLARGFGLMDSERAERREGTSEPERPTEGPPPTRLPYYRISLD